MNGGFGLPSILYMVLTTFTKRAPNMLLKLSKRVKIIPNPINQIIPTGLTVWFLLFRKIRKNTTDLHYRIIQKPVYRAFYISNINRMKKCIILVLAAICVACENYIEIPEQSDAETSITKQSVGATENLHPLMVAFPGKEKQLFETNSGILLEQYDTCYIYQGDIVLSKHQFEILNQQQAPGTRGAIITSFAQYWPDCTVYYEFHPDFEGKAIARIAMDSISSRTGVKFIQKSDPTQDCIYFFHGEGNHSSLGRQGGMQSISIQHGCNQQSFWEVFAHEILHALGIQHEMARYDRDDYIDIYWDNIIPSKAFAFQKYIDSGMPGDEVSRFNAISIMMYDSYAFGKVINGKTQLLFQKRMAH